MTHDDMRPEAPEPRSAYQQILTLAHAESDAAARARRTRRAWAAAAFVWGWCAGYGVRVWLGG